MRASSPSQPFVLIALGCDQSCTYELAAQFAES
jgi:hypothetical protein